MTGLDVLAFFLGGAVGYLLAVWTTRRRLESLVEQLEATQEALLAERKARFSPRWELQRLRLSEEEAVQ